VLYFQAHRASVQRENPTLSTHDISRLLGKMWKEIPSDQKLPYKEQAAALQETFKREHPGYTYKKARMKRRLNEVLIQNAPVVSSLMFSGMQERIYKQALRQPRIAPQFIPQPPITYPQAPVPQFGAAPRESRQPGRSPQIPK
jgi:hypothetical protein